MEIASSNVQIMHINLHLWLPRSELNFKVPNFTHLNMNNNNKFIYYI